MSLNNNFYNDDPNVGPPIKSSGPSLLLIFIVGIVVIGIGVAIAFTVGVFSPEDEIRETPIVATDRETLDSTRVPSTPAPGWETIFQQVQNSVVAVRVYENELLRGQGSGVIYDPDGLVLTASHVLEGHLSDTGRTEVYLWNRQGTESVQNARILGMAPCRDIALLELPAGSYESTALSNTGLPNILGDVMAVGYPLTDKIEQDVVRPSPDVGRITDYPVEYAGYDNLIRHDAPVNKGNSGGPLFDMMGNLIGINTLNDPDANNISFAPSIDTVLTVAEQLLRQQPVQNRTISIGESIEAELQNATERHCYSFFVPGGTSIEIDALSLGVNPVLSLYSPENMPVAFNRRRATGEFDAFISYNIPRDGIYTVVVHSTRPSLSGLYRLRVAESSAVTD